MLPALYMVVNNAKEGHLVHVITALPVFCQESKGYRLYVVKMMNCLCKTTKILLVIQRSLLNC